MKPIEQSVFVILKEIGAVRFVVLILLLEKIQRVIAVVIGIGLEQDR
jgi:hypothetical protein